MALLCSAVYRRRGGLTELEVGGELLLHDRVHDSVFVLNATAAAVWDLCDGSHSIDAVSVELERTIGTPANVITRDVSDVMAQLLADGLLLPK